MAEAREDDSVASRRNLGGPILPPPPPGLAEDSGKSQEAKPAQERSTEAKSQAGPAEARPAKKSAVKKSTTRSPRQARADKERAKASGGQGAEAVSVGTSEAPAGRNSGLRRPRAGAATQATNGARTEAATTPAAPRRTRRAQLRLVQVDAWSVMKTSFLLSIALGIVLVVAVAIIWAVLGASGVWDAVNSVAQQAVGGTGDDPFRIQDYLGTSRVLGFTMIVAVLDVILITAIATLGAFLYNLSAALLGGIEVTLAEDN